MNTATAAKARILTDKPANEHSQTADISDWQTAMRSVITSPQELLDILELDTTLLSGAIKAAELFPLRVPRGYVDRMEKGNPNDPLLRQILPLAEESLVADGFVDDAVGDINSIRSRGLLQKYEGRALLITTAACAVHCRFCFRRAFPYQENIAARDDWQEALDILRQDQSISEVILSGGDPLSLSDKKLSTLASRLDNIPHIKRLRLHTRQPVVLPERVDANLLDWLSHRSTQRVIVLHANHVNELKGPVRQAIRSLGDTGATLLNQAVLLKGVNDSIDSLKALSEGLFELGVLPYYIHLLDRVNGTAHFEVPEYRAKKLIQEMAAALPGYLVPKLVKEEIGKSNKTNVLW